MNVVCEIAATGNPLIGQVQGAPGKLRSPIDKLQGALGQVQGIPGQVQGAPGKLRSPIDKVQGALGQVQGIPGKVQGAPGKVQGAPGTVPPPIDDEERA